MSAAGVVAVLVGIKVVSEGKQAMAARNREREPWDVE
jgi:hypothetical protein